MDWRIDLNTLNFSPNCQNQNKRKTKKEQSPWPLADPRILFSLRNKSFVSCDIRLLSNKMLSRTIVSAGCLSGKRAFSSKLARLTFQMCSLNFLYFTDVRFNELMVQTDCRFYRPRKHGKRDGQEPPRQRSHSCCVWHELRSNEGHCFSRSSRGCITKSTKPHWSESGIAFWKG